MILFKEFAKEINLEKKIQEKIEKIIILTENHLKVDLEDKNSMEQLFLDLDMSIVGSESEEYLEYSKKVRKEYSHFKDSDFFKGRLAFLESIKGK